MKRMRRSTQIAIALLAALALSLTLLVSCDDPKSRENLEVKISDLEGYIDEQGNWVIEPKFRSAETFTDAGYAVVSNYETLKLGVINTSGEWVIKPQFKRHFSFIDDDLIFAEDPETGLSGIMNMEGKWVAEPTMDNISVYAFGFFDRARYLDNETELWGFMDKTGTKVLPAQFLYLGPLGADGLAVAQDSTTGLYGFVDKTGTWIHEPIYMDIKIREFSNGLFAMKDPTTELWGFIDASYNWKIAPAFMDVGRFSETGSCLAQDPDTGLWGVINTSGLWKAEALYTIDTEFPPYIFPNGLIAVQAEKDGLWGFIDSVGNWVVEPYYLEFRSSSNKYAVVKFPDTKLWGCIDSAGNVVVEPKFQSISSYGKNGLAPARLPDGA